MTLNTIASGIVDVEGGAKIRTNLHLARELLGLSNDPGDLDDVEKELSEGGFVRGSLIAKIARNKFTSLSSNPDAEPQTISDSAEQTLFTLVGYKSRRYVGQLLDGLRTYHHKDKGKQKKVREIGRELERKWLRPT